MSNQTKTSKLNSDLLQVISELGFTSLTPIQEQSIPLLLAGKDLVAQAKTGSGKTAAFALPLLQNLHPNGRKLQGLILCPTRELCSQVAREIRKLGRRHAGLQVLVVSGGIPLRGQWSALEKGVHIVVGTPGRILDHLQRGSIDLSNIRTVVLDEADRMLDMGFQEDMEKILTAVPKKRQTAFFSATYPHTIEKMSKAFQNQPERIILTSDDNQATSTIQQILYEADSSHKDETLLWILKKFQPESALVFCNQKATAKELAAAIASKGLSVASLHGDLEQIDRDRVMAKFRNHSVRVLIATDVAARGIDIANLDLVVNFDMPLKPEIYVHRIGRTGRAGQKGIAISLATPQEKHKLKAIETFLETSIERQSLPTVDQISEEASKRAHLSESKMTTFYIHAGRKEKLRPGDILGALTGEAAGLDAEDVGKIEIHDHFSYVAVATPVAKLALKSLQQGQIKGRNLFVELVR